MNNYYEEEGFSEAAGWKVKLPENIEKIFNEVNTQVNEAIKNGLDVLVEKEALVKISKDDGFYYAINPELHKFFGVPEHGVIVVDSLPMDFAIKKCELCASGVEHDH